MPLFGAFSGHATSETCSSSVASVDSGQRGGTDLERRPRGSYERRSSSLLQSLIDGGAWPRAAGGSGQYNPAGTTAISHMLPAERHDSRGSMPSCAEAFEPRSRASSGTSEEIGGGAVADQFLQLLEAGFRDLAQENEFRLRGFLDEWLERQERHLGNYLGQVKNAFDRCDAGRPIPFNLQAGCSPTSSGFTTPTRASASTCASTVAPGKSDAQLATSAKLLTDVLSQQRRIAEGMLVLRDCVEEQLKEVVVLAKDRSLHEAICALERQLRSSQMLSAQEDPKDLRPVGMVDREFDSSQMGRPQANSSHSSSLVRLESPSHVHTDARLENQSHSSLIGLTPMDSSDGLAIAMSERQPYSYQMGQPWMDSSDLSGAVELERQSYSYPMESSDVQLEALAGVPALHSLCDQLSIDELLIGLDEPSLFA